MVSVFPSQPLAQEQVFTFSVPIEGDSDLLPWEPDTQLGSKLVAWVNAKATASITKDGSGNVESIASLVGSMSVFSWFNSGTSVKPVYAANAWQVKDALGAVWNTQPAITFNPNVGNISGSILSCPDFPTNDAGYWVWMVYKRLAQLDGASTGIRPMVHLQGPLVSAVREDCYLGFARPTVDAGQTVVVAGQFTSGGGTITNNASISGVANGDQSAILAKFGAGGVAIAEDAGPDSSVAPYYAVPNTSGRFDIGGTYNGPDGAAGFVLAEMLVTTTDLTTDQINAMWGYLNWNWGRQSALPTTQAYYNDGPYNAA